MKQLSISARPRNLDQLVGQDAVVRQIRGHIKAGRTVSSWMFIGPTGTGKTTIARILALALNCPHQTKFGVPCKECYRNKSQYDIYEINAAKQSGKEDIEDALSAIELMPRVGKYRVYICDEIQKFSKHAQSSLLKALEDVPETTVFILCTTDPEMVIQTIQSRCITYAMRELGYDDVETYVAGLLKRVGSKLPADRLASAATERGVTLPRFLAQAVEKYIAGAKPEVAVVVEASAVVDTRALTRSLIKGDWQRVSKYLKAMQPGDVKAVRLGTIAYLRTVLQDWSELDTKGSKISEALTYLCELRNAEELVISAGLTAVLYKLAKLFEGYQL